MNKISFKSKYGNEISAIFVHRCILNIIAHEEPVVFEHLGYNMLVCLCAESSGWNHPNCYHLEQSIFVWIDSSRKDYYSEEDYLDVLSSDRTKDISDDEVIDIAKKFYYHQWDPDDPSTGRYSMDLDTALRLCRRHTAYDRKKLFDIYSDLVRKAYEKRTLPYKRSMSIAEYYGLEGDTGCIAQIAFPIEYFPRKH